MLNFQKVCDTFAEFMNREEKIREFFENLKLHNIKEIYIKFCDELYNFPLKTLAENNDNLRKLVIPYCWSRVGIGFESLANNCKFVEELNINSCGLSNQSLQFLKKFTNLKVIHLARTKIADLTLIEIGKNNSNLEIVNLFNCTRITKKGVEGFLKEAKKVRRLNLVGTKLNLAKRILIYNTFPNVCYTNSKQF